MKTRVGPVRVLLATVATLGLILPVGVLEGHAARAISVAEAVAELGHGRLGVGVLFAFGSGLEAAALVRLGIVAAAWIAFVLVRRIWADHAQTAPAVVRRRTCPSCGFRAAGDPAHCPSCHARLRDR